MSDTTIRQAAREGLAVQDACNGSGIVRTLCGLMEVIREDAGGSTDGTNRHPVFQLFVAKLVELCGQGFADPEAYRNAYRACQALEAGPAICKRCHEERAFCVCIQGDEALVATSRGTE